MPEDILHYTVHIIPPPALAWLIRKRESGDKTANTVMIAVDKCIAGCKACLTCKHEFTNQREPYDLPVLIVVAMPDRIHQPLPTDVVLSGGVCVECSQAADVVDKIKAQFNKIGDVGVIEAKPNAASISPQPPAKARLRKSRSKPVSPPSKH